MRILKELSKEHAEKKQQQAKEALEKAVQAAVNNDWLTVTGALQNGGTLLNSLSGIACLNEENVLLYKRLLRASLSQAVFLTLTADDDGEFSDRDSAAYGSWVAVELLETEFKDPGFRVTEGGRAYINGGDYLLSDVVYPDSRWVI